MNENSSYPWLLKSRSNSENFIPLAQIGSLSLPKSFETRNDVEEFTGDRILPLLSVHSIQVIEALLDVFSRSVHGCESSSILAGQRFNRGPE